MPHLEIIAAVASFAVLTASWFALPAAPRAAVRTAPARDRAMQTAA